MSTLPAAPLGSSVASAMSRRDRLKAGFAKARGLFPLTWLGVCVIAFAVVTLRFFAFREMDLVALVLGWGAVGLVSLSFVIVVISAAVAAATLSKAPGRALRMPTGTSMPTAFSVPQLAYVPLLTVDVTVRAPQYFERTLVSLDGRWTERVTAHARGAYESIERLLSYGDVFGLTRISFSRVEERSVFVMPHLGRLTQMPTLRSLASGDALAHPSGTPDGDRIDLRRYAPGDPARFIHWKVFGRTRKLVVRVQERALAPSRRVVAYLVAGPDDEATAASALAAVKSDALGSDWLFGADGTPMPTSDPDMATAAIVRSKAFVDDSARDLEAFLRTVEREGPASLVLFVAPLTGPALDRLLAVTRPRGVPTQVVIGIDAIVEAPAASLAARVLQRPATSEGVSRGILDAMRSRLASAGADVIIVERPTGRVIAAHGQVSSALRSRAA